MIVVILTRWTQSKGIHFYNVIISLKNVISKFNETAGDYSDTDEQRMIYILFIMTYFTCKATSGNSLWASND
jgi:hypothetical protein